MPLFPIFNLTSFKYGCIKILCTWYKPLYKWDHNIVLFSTLIIFVQKMSSFLINPSVPNSHTSPCWFPHTTKQVSSTSGALHFNSVLTQSTEDSIRSHRLRAPSHKTAALLHTWDASHTSGFSPVLLTNQLMFSLLHLIKFAGVAHETQRNVLLTGLLLCNKRIFLRSSQIGEKQRPRYGKGDQNLMLSLNLQVCTIPKLSETLGVSMKLHYIGRIDWIIVNWFNIQPLLFPGN